MSDTVAGTGQEWDAAGIFALRLNTFEDWGASSTSGQSSQSYTAGVWKTDEESVTVNPTSTGDFLVAGGGLQDDTTLGLGIKARLQKDNSTITDTDGVGGWSYDNDDYSPDTVANFETSLSTGSKTFDLDSVAINTGTGTFKDTYLVVFSMELARSYPIVQEDVDDSNGGTSLTLTFPSTPIENNLLVAVMFTRGSNQPSTATMPTGWSTAVERNDTTSNDWIGIYYKVVGASESTTHTWSGLSTDSHAIYGAEYAGLATSSVYDVSASTPRTSATTIASGTTATTSQADELAIAGFSSRTSVTASSYSNSFIEDGEAFTTAGNPTEIYAAYKELSTTGTQSSILTKSATSVSLGAIATFKAAGAAGPTQVDFTTAARTITAGTCSGAGSVITIQLKNAGGTPTNPTGATVIRITSNSPTTEEIYSDSSCSTQLTNGDISFSTSENTKSFYIIDTRKSNPTWTLTASKQSGPDTISDDTQTITVNAGSVTRLQITLPGQTFTDGTGNSGSPTARTAGSSFNITSISATDNYNNVNTGYSGSKTLVYSGPSDAPDTTSPTYTTSVSFTSGQSTTTLSTTLYDAETTTITVTDGGSYGYASSSVTVNAGNIENYLVSEDESSFIAGSCSSATIQARDDWHNNLSGDTSTVNATDSGTAISFYTSGTCGTGTSTYTLSGGTATAYYSSTDKQGNFTVTMTKQSDTPTGTSGNIYIDPARAEAILVRLPGESFSDGTGITGSDSFTGLRSPNATAGTSFDVTLYAVDIYNNLVDNGVHTYGGAKTISWTDSTAGNAPDSTPPSFPVGSVTFTDGISSAQTITYYNAATLRTVEADDTGTPVSGSTSSTFTVQAGAEENYLLSASTPQTAGVAFNVTITARDDWENTMGSLYSAPAGTYSWITTAGDAPDTTSPVLGTLVQGDFSAGVATKSVTLYNNESGVTFTASEPGPSTVTGTSNTVTVNVGKISAHPGDSTVTGNESGGSDTPIIMAITLKDTWENPISGVSSSNISLSADGSPTVNQPTSDTDANGQTTGTLSWSGAGSYTVSVEITTVDLVQNDGSTPDADGFLDDTHGITISIQPNSSTFQGGSTIQGGATIR